ncbi:hypothetical protein N2152v2_005456 [Parachlorella kessleri]
MTGGGLAAGGSWRMLEALAGLTGVRVDGQNPVAWMLETAQAANISVIRAFATGVTPELTLQLQPGVYNLPALTALDQLLDLAAKRGIKLTLILARNWGAPDAKTNYASWNGLPVDDFFGSPQARDDFKAHISFMVNRTNTVNGRRYRDDPTIFSWNLMNEPRFFGNNSQCHINTPSCTATLQSWIEDISKHLKSVDPNHMITVGEEGFYGLNSPQNSHNPQAPGAQWASETGQDFVNNMKIPTIDYAEAHVWYDNWGVDPVFASNWAKWHMDDARSMGKPLVLEEFGKNVTSQDPAASSVRWLASTPGLETFHLQYRCLHNHQIIAARNVPFATLFGLFNTSLQNDDVLRGIQYWMWDPSLHNPSNPGWANYSQDQVLTDSSTFKDIILPSARAAAARSRKAVVVPGCTPAAAAPAASAPVAATPGAPAPQVVNAGPGPAPAANVGAPAGTAGRRLRGWATLAHPAAAGGGVGTGMKR